MAYNAVCERDVGILCFRNENVQLKAGARTTFFSICSHFQFTGVFSFLHFVNI